MGGACEREAQLQGVHGTSPAPRVLSTKDDPQALNTWVAEVRRRLAPWQSQGVAGLPDDWVVSKKINVPKIYRCLETAVGKRTWAYCSQSLRKVSCACPERLG